MAEVLIEGSSGGEVGESTRQMVGKSTMEGLGSVLSPSAEENYPTYLGHYYIGGGHGIREGRPVAVAAYHIYSLALELERDGELRRKWEERYGKDVVEGFIEKGKALGDYLRGCGEEGECVVNDVFKDGVEALQRLYNAVREREGWSISVNGEEWGGIPVDGIFGILTYHGLEKLVDKMAKDRLEEMAQDKLEELKSPNLEDVVEGIPLKRGNKGELAYPNPDIRKRAYTPSTGREVKYSHFIVRRQLPSGEVENTPLTVPHSSYERNKWELELHRGFAFQLSEALGLLREGKLFQDLISLIISGRQEWEVPSKGGSYVFVMMRKVGDRWVPMTEEEQRAFVEANVVRNRFGGVNRYATLHKIFSDALENGYKIILQTPNGRVEFVPTEAEEA